MWRVTTIRRVVNAPLTLALTIVLAGALALGAVARAEEATRRSGVADLASLKQYVTVPNFKIGGRYDVGNPASYENGGEGGVTLESLGAGPLRLAYIAVGTPKRNSKGEITNAVIVSAFYSGDAAISYFLWQQGQPGNAPSGGAVVGPGELIDTNKHYVVYLDALGLWGTSKPSEGLGMRFPQYNFYDFVQANYRLLRDHLKIAKVQLATGISMGAIQSYIWAILHPEYVDAIMPIAGLPAKDPVVLWLFDLMTAAIKSDPAWMNTKGDYYHLPKAQHPNQGVKFGWSVIGHTGESLNKRVNENYDDVRKEVFSWDKGGGYGANLERRTEMDANELILRNEGIHSLDLWPYLPGIKAKTLIIHVANDQWVLLAPTQTAAKMIPGAKLATFEHPRAHYAGAAGPNTVRPDVEAFFKEIGLR